MDAEGQFRVKVPMRGPCGFLLLASVLVSGCPETFGHGAIGTGVGWSADVIIYDGFIHTARRNYDTMTLEYAYRRNEGGDWEVETVDRFLKEGEEAYMLVGPESGSVLRLAVEGDSVYLAYVGLEKVWDDGALDGMKGTSFKLAERRDGQWHSRELRRIEGLPGDPQVLGVARSSGRTYVLYSRDCYECASGELAVVENQTVTIHPLGTTRLEDIGLAENPVVMGDLVLESGRILSCSEVLNVVTTQDPSFVALNPRCVLMKDSHGPIAALFFSGVLADPHAPISVIYAVRNSEWTVTRASYPRELATLPQGWKHDTRPFHLVLRYTDGDLKKGSFGIVSLKDGSFEVDWVEVPPIVYDKAIRFDVSLPDIVVTFPSLDNSKNENRRGPHGKRHYNIRRATHHVYVWDGATWTHETIP